jgi:hypothetical protein
MGVPCWWVGGCNQYSDFLAGPAYHDETSQQIDFEPVTCNLSSSCMIGRVIDNGVTMKITDLKCAVIGGFPVVRITTDEGIDGIGYSIYV